MGDDVFERLMKAVLDPNPEAAASAAEEVLKSGVDPLEAISKGLSEGMKVVGRRFRDSEIFLPEVMEAADAFSAAMTVLEPKILESGAGSQKVGTVVIGTVQNDVHNIGKNIVANLLKTAGFEVIDLGEGVKPSAFIDEAEKAKADVIASSSLLTTTMAYQQEIVEFMKAEGVRDKYFCIVGGAPVDQSWADEIGADAFGMTAQDAVDICLAHMGQKKGGKQS